MNASLLLTLALAATPADTEADVAACISQAATAFQVDPMALELIREVEGGQPGSASRNDNGSVDLGVMQVNSWWLPRLKALGITRDELQNDTCINVSVAAWIYVQEFAQSGDMARAVAAYHSPTPRHQARYLRLVERAIDRRIAVSRPGRRGS